MTDDIKTLVEVDEPEVLTAVPSSGMSSEREKALKEAIGGSWGKYPRFILAVLGSIPWVGVVSALAAFQAERGQEKTDTIQFLWLQEHEGKIRDLKVTIDDVLKRLDGFGAEIQKRIESPEYLVLVRKAFRSWDEADTEEKRQMLKKLITNAGGQTLCPDDLVRLFVQWINTYHEAHFMVIREIYKSPGATRGQIWDRVRGVRPRENSAEADLFRYLIRDLSTGGVIRQQRDVNELGEFLSRSSSGPRSPKGTTKVMESAFENTKAYVLTELGGQFVHYVMEDMAPQLQQGQKQQ